MLGVQDQRLVERVGVQLRGLLAVQQVQEVRGDAVIVGLQFDATAVAGEMPPVQQHRAKAGDELVGDVARFRCRVTLALRQHRSQHRATRTHDIHRMRIRGHQFQRLLHDCGQATQALQLGLVGIELRLRRQRTVHQQVGDFLERRLRSEVVDVVATVVQVVAATANRAQRGVARGGAAQRDGFLGLGKDLGGVSH